MIIGYARVSTDDQHLDLQLQALRAYGCDTIYSDQGISGARFDRPGLRDALDALQFGDTLVVWKLDRLGRSLGNLVVVMSELEKKDIRVVSLTECIDTVSPAGRFSFHMIAALAEFERALISERTRAGIAAARERGRKIGRPVALSVLQQQEVKSLRGVVPEAQLAQTYNVHVRTLQRHLAKAKHAG